ncbi:hypothetical protein Lal_00047429 [Lupinus albus]|uniref:Uncharacterized protein n=1 Tax=Lupinus albus TaxID=3870 RepID=A0A6A5MYS7_LUPAL|nr:putative protein kinase RLK-Pelle-DLSV family [Lupinus albus]KAF1878757.1 hypothetical protein Lal_00047429 [Lupinus albus]
MGWFSLFLGKTTMMVLSPRPLSFVYCILVIIISLTKTSSEIISVKYCNPSEYSGNYTTNSTYHTNLNTLLSNLTSNTETNNYNGFYNVSYGQNTNKVYAIGLCRGDVKRDNCHSCLNNAIVNLTQYCPNQKEAYAWYDDETCLLYYSDRLIYGVLIIEPWDYSWDGENEMVVDAVQFNRSLINLMDSLITRAALGDSSRKYATSSVVGPNNHQTIYGLVQCRPDLSGTDCSGCLNESMLALPGCCNNMKGARILRPSCILRYGTNTLFYDPEADAPPPAPSNNNTSSQGNSNVLKVALAVALPVVVVVLLLSFIIIYLRVRKPKQSFEAQEDDYEIQTADSLQFDFDAIQEATNDFSDANKLGQGGFGIVYRGRLSNGQEIAVKRLSRDSGQGDIEFKNEVLLVAKLQHRNLVRLLGFSIQRKERLLVYEFVPNKSLDHFIFDPTEKRQLDWESRYKIIGGIARGIVYLHEDSRLRIIHRDLKASNILLDEEMNPKISDFGMARLFDVDQTQGETNKVVGTYGYMAPEYALCGQYSVKSDVFSFGVLVLEIVSGRKRSSIRHGENVEDLLSFAWRNWRAGTVANIVDSTLTNVSETEIMRCIHIGLLCIQENVADRPTMGAIILMHNNNSVSLAVPSEPPSSVDSKDRFLPDMQSWEHNSDPTRSRESTNTSAPISVNEASISELFPR